MIVICEFDRIGKNHNVPPFETEVAEADDALAQQVVKYASKYLGSRCVDVFMDMDEGLGRIIVGGLRPAGKFTITTIQG